MWSSFNDSNGVYNISIDFLFLFRLKSKDLFKKFEPLERDRRKNQNLH